MFSPPCSKLDDGSHVASVTGYPFHRTKYQYPWPRHWCLRMVSISYCSSSLSMSGGGQV